MPKVKLENGNLVTFSLLDLLKSDKTTELQAAFRVGPEIRVTASGLFGC